MNDSHEITNTKHSFNYQDINTSAVSAQSAAVTTDNSDDMDGPPIHHGTAALTSAVAPQGDAVQKKRFLLFIKILFQCLGQSEETAETRETAKTIVSDCTRRNRLGDPNYRPLMDAIDRRLRRHVGEAHWRRAHLYLQHYVRREQDEARARRGRPQPQRTALV